MNLHEERSIRSYSKKADHYDQTLDGRMTRKIKRLLFERVAIADGSRLLDVACGNGRLLNMFSQNYNFLGYGVDISPEMVKNASQLNPTMTFAAAPCDKLPFQDATFDRVTVCAAFHHFPDPAAFAREACRVLKPNGVLTIAEFHYSAPVRFLLNPLVRFSPAGDVKMYAPAEITALLEQAGYLVQSVFVSGSIQIIEAQKKAG